jgi:uncharacterized protein YegL
MKQAINKHYLFSVVMVFILLSNFHVYGQRLSFFDLDTTSFPTVKAKFYAYDENWNLLKPSIPEIIITENGNVRAITNLICPPPKNPQDLSAVLIIDVSGSMERSGLPIAKAAAEVWINALPNGSDCAIVTFTEENHLVQDFTNNKALLFDKIQTLQAGGGTDFDAALINEPAGGLLISGQGKNKPVIIMLTDGHAAIPQIDLIVETANQQNCTIYMVTLGMECPQVLKEISQRTGGVWFENINSQSEAEFIYRNILGIVQGDSPCEIEWESIIKCEEELFNVNLRLNDMNSEAKYELPYSSLANLMFGPEFIYFPDMEIGIKRDTTITVTAINADMEVFSISSSNPAFEISPTSFQIDKNQSIELTISYLPSESGYLFSKFEFNTDLCYASFFASGGKKLGKPEIITLKLLHPNGGEEFVIGSDTIITWEGVTPSDTCILEYSTDSGQTWNLLTEQAFGLKYDWRNIPALPSKECLVRISQPIQTDLRDRIPIIDWQKIYGGSNADFATHIIQTNDGGYILVGSTDSEDYGIPLSKGRSDIIIIKIDINGKMEWVKTYGGSNYDDITQVIQTSDLGYILAGNTLSNDGDIKNHVGLMDIWILKLNATGDIDWKRTYGGTNSEIANSILETSDFGYIVSGYTGSADGDITNNQGKNDAWVFKLDPIGNMEWQRTYGGTLDDKFSSLIETSDGAYIAIGNTESRDGDVTANNGMNDIWIVKIAPPGIILWEKTFGGNLNDFGISIVESIDGMFYIAGNSESSDLDVSENKGKQDIWLLKIDPVGNLIFWEKSFGGSENDIVAQMILTEDEKLVIAGSTGSNDGDITENKGLIIGVLDYWLLKVDLEGELIWQKTFGGHFEDKAESIQQTIDKGFIVAGISQSNNGDVSENRGEEDIWLIKLYPDELIFQQDVSDTLFSIVEPIASSRDIDMLQVLVGTSKDSVVSEFIMNTGSWKFRVDSIYIQGADASAFSLVSGFPKYPIEPSQSNHAEFRFVPNRVGIHTAEIVIVTQAEKIIQNIIGEGVEPRLEIVNSLIDFGTIYVGEMVDTLQAVTVKNIGNASLEILDTKHNYPNTIDFSTIAGGGNIILQPGQEALMDLRFSANSPGRTSGTLEFHYDGVGSPAVVQLFGEGTVDSDSSAITLEVLDAEGYASDAVKVYIIVTDSYLMQFSRTESFSLELNFNPSMLYPLDFTMDYIDERHAKIKIEDLPVDVETGDTLATIWFRAGLGNAEISELELTNIEAIGGNTTITHEDGTFQLLGICYEGGTRLFNANSKAGIESVNPNPAENLIQINVSFSEGGQTEILLYNLKGEIVRTIFNADIRAEKSISLDTDITDLTTGSYTLIFKSPTFLQKTQLLIVK